ncbi:hypothetical protein M0R45_015766 [Rubus argutus]|uniref:Uncharacterized protein n=1 Tax=Rubus argutus TaxID=59490 RepID=A0AAW1XQM1_RUBAR
MDKNARTVIIVVSILFAVKLLIAVCLYRRGHKAEFDGKLDFDMEGGGAAVDGGPNVDCGGGANFDGGGGGGGC